MASVPGGTGGFGGSDDPIDGVLAQLDEILAWCIDNGSRAGYFAALYRRVTRTVRQRIGTGYFDDDARMEVLDVTFASRYLQAFSQWRSGDPAISACWRVAFDGVADPTLLILQNLLVGMNAHITYDLGIATAQVAATPAGLASIHGDFDKINALLACLVPTVFAELGTLSPLIHLLEDMGEDDEQKLVNVAMEAARDFAWLFANELVIVRGDPDLEQTLLDLKDKEASWIGDRLLHPGGSVEKVCHVVWLAESKDVARNIEVLAAPEVLPASCG
ncbi:MAG TPA: DUF5995 family protein [Thermoanaerobaculia bacterium]|nr:DUF5995 family protein [Thermoanaerobaculia bacterium]